MQYPGSSRIFRKSINFLQNPEANTKMPKSNNFRTKSGKSNLYKSANKYQNTISNRNNNNYNRYQSAKNKNKNNFDVRMVFCLKMLGILVLN
jgi:hypothetical protein